MARIAFENRIVMNVGHEVFANAVFEVVQNATCNAVGGEGEGCFNPESDIPKVNSDVNVIDTKNDDCPSISVGNMLTTLSPSALSNMSGGCLAGGAAAIATSVIGGKGKLGRNNSPGVVGGSKDAFRGPSQRSPGGQNGPAVSVEELKRCLGQCGMSVRDYDIVHVPVIPGPNGYPAFGKSPHNFSNEPNLGPRGRPLIEISDMGLSSMQEAVTTVFHEIYHHRSYALSGSSGGERRSEAYGRAQWQEFSRRSGR
jgi:hypothetical protein